MCGRFNLRQTPAELQAVFDLFRIPQFSARYNIAPTQLILSLRQDAAGHRVADWQKWGLIPRWATDPRMGHRMLNARSETAAEKPSFRDAFRHRRCVIPASGFYEWQSTVGKTKQPWHIFARDGLPLAFAGFWERWHPPGGEPLETCTILTTSANGVLQPLHDRMPVILDRAQIGLWLDPGLTDPAPLAPLLLPCPDEWLDRQPVSPLVNSPRNESPRCLEPIAPSDGSLIAPSDSPHG